MDKIGQYILGDNLKVQDFEQIVDDREVAVTIKRMSTTGNGFSTELSDYATIGTITARVDNVRRYYQHQAVKSTTGDVKKNHANFIGITRDPDYEVRMGDVWQVGDAALTVISLIGGDLQNRTEVMLSWFLEGVQIVNT
jgi:flavin-dependent dehydrogenase